MRYLEGERFYAPGKSLLSNLDTIFEAFDPSRRRQYDYTTQGTTRHDTNSEESLYLSPNAMFVIL